MDDQDVSAKERWARFRLQVLGPLLASPPGPGELQSAIRELSERVYQHPLHRGTSIRLGFSTIERWYYQARDVADPVSALRRKVRSDAGGRFALSEAHLSVLATQYQQYPRWTVQLHYDNLAAEVANKPELGRIPSYQTVRRLMREKGWLRRKESANPTEGQRRAARRRLSHEIRSYEASHVHALWHLDFHQGSVKVVDKTGAWHTPLACAVIDDCSRLCCHLQWYPAESARNLIHALTQAFLKRGLPRSLMTDNGAAMTAEETTEGLARLGVNHETTLPYSPYQNGKQEVFWAQLEGRLMELLRGTGPLTLTELNHVSQAWVEQDYHRRTHSEIKTSPLSRMLAGPSVVRPAPALEALQLAFTRKVSRTQRRSDGTVTVDGVRFELPSRYRTLNRVKLRYTSWDMSRLHLMDKEGDTVLTKLLPQDKQQNANGLRRCHETVSPLPVETEHKPVPALVGKWLAEYAATGLPPAFLANQENFDEP
jgi:putative transposase